MLIFNFSDLIRVFDGNQYVALIQTTTNLTVSKLKSIITKISFISLFNMTTRWNLRQFFRKT